MIVATEVEAAGETVAVCRGYHGRAGHQIHFRGAQPALAAISPSPVLCLHMSPASSLIYETLLGHLGTDRLALAPDTPGFGQSDPLPPYPEIGDYARTLLDFVTSCGIDRPVDLVGYHTGAIIACEMARQAPMMVRKIVMISAPVFTEQDLVAIRPSYREESLFTNDGERLRDKWLWFQRFLGVGRTVDCDYAADIFVERLLGKERHWWGHRAAFGYDLAATLRATRHPITVLNLADDLEHITRRAAGLLPPDSLIELPHLTHGLLDHHAAEVTDLLRRLLQ